MFLIMIFSLCACSGNKEDVVGIWKFENDIATEYARYMYVYEEGYSKMLIHNHEGPYDPEYEWTSGGYALDWEYDGKTFTRRDPNTGEVYKKYIVEDGKMYGLGNAHVLLGIKVSNDTSNEKPSYNE